MSSCVPEVKNLKKLLEESYKKDITILKCTAKLLTAPGENYGSIMLALDATIKVQDEQPETKNFVAKLCPTNEMLHKMFQVQITVKKEISMYLDAIPALTSLEEEYNIRENKVSDMFAKCFGGRINLIPGSTKVDNDAVLIFENLKVRGYDVGDRLTGFDLEHAELVVKNLARFHAVPIALRILKPNIFNEKVLPCLQTIMLGESFDDKIIELWKSEVVDVLRKKSECILYIDKVVKSIEYNLIGPYRKLEGKKLGPFATIVHSDYWVNNTMILRDEYGKPIHSKMVDFQFPIYNSGSFDLIFFLYTSVMPSVLNKNFDKLIDLYYDSFINRLKLFNVDVCDFSKDAFLTDLSSVAPLELGHILTMLKPILTKRGEIDDMNNFDENHMYRKDIVSDDYVNRIIDTVISFIDRKWL